MTNGPLSGRRILLVEDDFFQAREAKAFLERAGAEVTGPTGHAEDVPQLLSQAPVDAAVVDINLGRGADFAVPRTLRDNGIPFVFLTGYDEAIIPGEYATVPRVEKPANAQVVVSRLAQLL